MAVLEVILEVFVSGVFSNKFLKRNIEPSTCWPLPLNTWGEETMSIEVGEPNCTLWEHWC